MGIEVVSLNHIDGKNCSMWIFKKCNWDRNCIVITKSLKELQTSGVEHYGSL